MPNFAVMSRFGAKDKISGAFKKMGRNAGAFEKKSKKSFQGASRAGSTFKDTLKGILSAGLIQQGLQKLKQGLGSFIKEGSKIEDATANFTPLMGGISGATKLVEALNKTAATTPFQFDTISNTAQQLLPAMNKDIGKTIETFRQLGDTVGGNAQKLKTVSSVYSRAILKNKLETGDLNILTGAGIPIYTELAKSMGVTVEQMASMTAKGKVTGKELQKVFKTMTSEGGIFFKGMELASATLTGKMSTLKDNIGLTFGIIGQTAFPILKKLIDKGTEFAVMIRTWINNNKEFIQSKIEDAFNRIKSVITTLKPGVIAIIQGVKNLFGILKALAESVIKDLIGKMISLEDVVSIIAKVFKFVGGIISLFAVGLKTLSPILTPLIAIFGIWTAAQWAINAAMTANPIGLLIIGIAAVIVGIGLLVKNWDVIKTKILDVWNTIKKFAANVGNAIKGFVAAVGKKISDFVQGFITVWNKVKEFMGGVGKKIAGFVSGFLGGIKKIGKAIFAGILAPIQGVLEALSKVPGAIGKMAKAGATKIKNLRESLFEDDPKEEGVPPNKEKEDQERQDRLDQFRFTGRLDIAGAPEGSDFKTFEAPGQFDVAFLGANP